MMLAHDQSAVALVGAQAAFPVLAALTEPIVPFKTVVDFSSAFLKSAAVRTGFSIRANCYPFVYINIKIIGAISVTALRCCLDWPMNLAIFFGGLRQHFAGSVTSIHIKVGWLFQTFAFPLILHMIDRTVITGNCGLG
jgi:hypothetical protein